MVFYQCPKCKNMVSEKAKACPACGCPIHFISGNKNMDRKNCCQIGEAAYRLPIVSELLSIGAKIEAIKYVKDSLGLDLKDSKAIIDYYEAHHEFPPDATGIGVDPSKVKVSPAIPKCPTCGSTNIESSGAGTKAAGVLFGLLGGAARSQFRCKNCGYQW